MTADVLHYPIPDDLTVAYLFNPFTGDIFHQILQRIIASIERRPRRVRLVYANPTMHGAVVATGAFSECHPIWPGRPVPPVWRHVTVYESKAGPWPSAAHDV